MALKKKTKNQLVPYLLGPALDTVKLSRKEKIE